MIKFTSCLPTVDGSLRVTLASSTNKTGRHDIAEVLLKVALNTKIKSNHQSILSTSCTRNVTFHFIFNQPISDYWHGSLWNLEIVTLSKQAHPTELLYKWSMYLTVLDMIGWKKMNERSHDMTPRMVLNVSVLPIFLQWTCNFN